MLALRICRHFVMCVREGVNCVSVCVYTLEGGLQVVQMWWSFHLSLICIGLGKFSQKFPLDFLWSWWRIVTGLGNHLFICLIPLHYRRNYFSQARLNGSKAKICYGWFVWCDYTTLFDQNMMVTKHIAITFFMVLMLQKCSHSRKWL